MTVLLTDLLPVPSTENQENFRQEFFNLLKASDQIEIAVGYISSASLDELDTQIRNMGLKNVLLLIGMYYVEGMPENSYHKARVINRAWRRDSIGEIRLITPIKYHGKIYVFYNNAVPFASIVGSANLGAIKLGATNRRQYEVSVTLKDSKSCQYLSEHVKHLASNSISECIEDVKKITLIRAC